jgi:hypothetical protein
LRGIAIGVVGVLLAGCASSTGTGARPEVWWWRELKDSGNPVTVRTPSFWEESEAAAQQYFEVQRVMYSIQGEPYLQYARFALALKTKLAIRRAESNASNEQVLSALRRHAEELRDLDSLVAKAIEVGKERGNTREYTRCAVTKANAALSRADGDMERVERDHRELLDLTRQYEDSATKAFEVGALGLAGVFEPMEFAAEARMASLRLLGDEQGFAVELRRRADRCREFREALERGLGSGVARARSTLPTRSLGNSSAGSRSRAPSRRRRFSRRSAQAGWK